MPNKELARGRSLTSSKAEIVQKYLPSESLVVHILPQDMGNKPKCNGLFTEEILAACIVYDPCICIMWLVGMYHK